MDHIARSFKVSLSITHPHADPDEISKILSLIPKRATRNGAPRTTPNGKSLEGTYGFSHWTYEFDVEGRELGFMLEGLLQQLQKHGPFFDRIVREGGAIELFCGVFVAGNWDEILSHSLMGNLAALRIDLRLDVYPNGATT